MLRGEDATFLRQRPGLPHLWRYDLSSTGIADLGLCLVSVLEAPLNSLEGRWASAKLGGDSLLMLWGSDVCAHLRASFVGMRKTTICRSQVRGGLQLVHPALLGGHQVCGIGDNFKNHVLKSVGVLVEDSLKDEVPMVSATQGTSMLREPPLHVQ